ncbi:glycoside hydrolase family 65 protein [Propionibacterium sp. NM47_B9-13]|jgi:alpha,alpha-trehalose phosphorylase|uniref:Kojibiose phosphorylase n=2 Tax=Cutibacterium modestum TaxID=2559073 RepID=A0AAD1KQF9_9ACTN|nr:glycosyl hydrolase family 65 protein [Cutibacterium modestum]TGY29327.1 glycoside hydrolase family 65 protein [Propionibacterium sp. NM47_B9-13]AOH44902.1 kojibiose phosphorylase [Cutibacterium modestum]EFS74761.1 glycosyl hydrolase family 65 central catalytic domain protein [Cutibacterium modestum HL037PA2]EFS91754.1 glycosyl hydrolase family 65 central catalytic domain protein [Cutibacterium modestum HL044PA1]EFT15919.1 glycosyl hydrolase family 65 central catalytic domain protein [Cutiba
MTRTGTDPMDRWRFPDDPWAIVETVPSTDDLGTTETLFSIGNGYLGMRGNPSEGRDSFSHGTYINGFHEIWDIHHAENAYGFARTGQTIVNVPDAKLMKLYVDDEPLLLSVNEIQSYKRWIDFREGVLHRELVWRTPAGKLLRVATSRMVSFTHRHMALISIEVTMLEGDAPIVISSQILNRQDGMDEYHARPDDAEKAADPRQTRKFADKVLIPQKDWHSHKRMILGFCTARSGMTLAVGADHEIITENEYESLIDTEPGIGKRVYRIEATQGRPIRIDKAVAYHTSRGVPVHELFDRVRRSLDRVREQGHNVYYDEQRAWLDDYWMTADVEVRGAPTGIQQAVRWNLFQIAQASARADQLGIPAKGVTGSGYEGHYFWDTEVYVIPMLTYTHPRIAENALRFRVNTLPQARHRARELSERGALFPWRTITGEEASAYYAAGTAQYHINADIVHAIMNHARATGDKTFLFRDAAPVLVETARMWADLGFWRINGGREFHIHGVTGPDEYTTVVNNNLYTNVMARANLIDAAGVIRRMRDEDPLWYEHLCLELDLTEDEVGGWEECAAGMVIPFDDTFGIHPQDDQFLSRELWDLKNTPDNKRPLLLHYHPLVIYRFQVLKQADVVLALFLQGDQFTQAVKLADFEYYDPITTGDSSLSAVGQSVMAAEVGHQEMAMDYFLDALFCDLADTHHNASDGVHVASAGGVWGCLVHGFVGMRNDRENLRFDPRLPAQWTSIKHHMLIGDSHMLVYLERDAITFQILSGHDRDVTVRGELYHIGVEPVRVPLLDQGPLRPSLRVTHPISGLRRADGSLITAEVPGSIAETIVSSPIPTSRDW